jgi:DNA (cytosine-5)-methyltransferase 1
MAEEPITPSVSPTFIDLFCGCGGFSLGLIRAGLRCLAAIDFNPEAVEVFRTNFADVPHVLEKDLSAYTPSKLAALLNCDRIDVIVGGPPCQGFSTVRQVDAANHGTRVKRDKRRYLFRAFLDYVEYFQPKVFVMENVLGLQSAAKGIFFTMVQAEARRLKYRVHPQVEEAWKLGVPQKRRRQLIIGVREDIAGFFANNLDAAQRAFATTPTYTPTLWDAIGDLPSLAAGAGEETRAYDLAKREKFLSLRGVPARHYLEKVLEVTKAAQLTAHKARPHNDRDLRDFLRIKEGEHGGQTEARGERLEFTYNRTCFQDRFKRQHRDQLCSTIVAHLAKDGLMFIHPTQNRSLTPREAARIQSFPDWFQFPVARTHQFRLIGNAVPPLVAEAVGEELRTFLESKSTGADVIPFELAPLPKDEAQAVEWLRPFLNDPTPRFLKAAPAETFKQAWYAIAFLYSGLHPDASLDHGDRITRKPQQDYPLVQELEPRLLTPYYERSGWPVVLAPIAREAWRRYRADELTDDEFYCSEAQMAGMCHRNPSLAGEIRLARATNT